MMNILKRMLLISWKNVFRNKRRSLLTLLILTLGSTGLLLVGGFFESLNINFQEQLIHTQLGHLQIHKKGFYEEGTSDPFKFLLSDISEIQNQIEKNPQVTLTLPRLIVSGMVKVNQSSIPVSALGVDAIREKKMGSYKGKSAMTEAVHFIQGQDLSAEDRYGVVLGKGLAESLDVKPGDVVNLVTTREGGAIDGAEYKVRGIFESAIKEFDDRTLKMNLEAAQEVMGAPNKIHSLLVLLNSTASTDAVQSMIDKKLQTFSQAIEVITWEKQGIILKQGKALTNKIYWVVKIIISAIFLLSIANTINMVVLERMREFGTMMAMGNSRAVLFSTIFLEVFYLSLLGSFMGLCLGWGFAHLISWIGIEMPPLPFSTTGYYASIHLYPKLFLEVFGISFISSLLASIFPGYRASHYKIVDALGHV
ncbi:MAG: ABC transporter permease [Deltaproteobacteria bacterium]|nr:ABC transporter permease [Deltaproteobacteria bacterium]